MNNSRFILILYSGTYYDSIKNYVDSNGRLAISAKIRKKLHIKVGDEVSIKYGDSELIVLTFQANIEKARDILSKYKNIDLQKELKSIRNEDAKKF
ncbi:MAG: AbrB/MazE/SpoVT family DNA-binding domain-containing protein [Candidatus Rickettsia vulgarisii]